MQFSYLSIAFLQNKNVPVLANLTMLKENNVFDGRNSNCYHKNISPYAIQTKPNEAKGVEGLRNDIENFHK